MDSKKLDNIFCKMREDMGAEELLEALYQALDTDTLEDHLRYIDRVYNSNYHFNRIYHYEDF